MGRYAGTDGFHWVKIVKVGLASDGEGVCDVSWLRPVGGAAGGSSYACDAGHDDTINGVGLRPGKDLRFASPEELAGPSPPGAGRNCRGRLPATAARQKSSAQSVVEAPAAATGQDLVDLLGEAVASPASSKSNVSAAEIPTASSNGIGNGWGSCFATAQVNRVELQPQLKQVQPHFKQQVAQPQWSPAAPQVKQKTDSQFDFVADILPPGFSCSCNFPVNVTPVGDAAVKRKDGNQFDFVSDILSGSLAHA